MHCGLNGEYAILWTNEYNVKQTFYGMKDFNYYAPTQVVFGRGTEDQVPALVRKYGGTKVLVHYGGGSAVRSGLLSRIQDGLRTAGIEFVSLGGVVPNPRLSMVHRGISLCREQGVDFLLAVGGGSVIDSCKAISAGMFYDGDVWDMYLGKANPSRWLPIGCVLTLPASGSEMSDSSVITNDDGGLKKGYNNDGYRCKFAVMNPELTYTLPAWQTACGAVDIMMHTMERYFSMDDDMEITDSLAEGLLRTVLNIAPKVLAEPDNYVYRSQLMWAGSLSHNGLTGCGTSGDWATHKLEHELSGMFDVSHGAGLSALWGSWARYVMDMNLPRFVRFAVNVMGVEQDFHSQEATAEAGIRALEAFFRSLGMPVDIHGLIGREIGDGEIAEMADKCSRGGTITVGCLKPLSRTDMENIYRMAR